MKKFLFVSSVAFVFFGGLLVVPALAQVGDQVAPSVAITRELRIGFRGEDVKILQTFLRQWPAIYSGPVTGYFGALTNAGVRKFQKQYGIKITGRLDVITRAKIQDLLLESTPLPVTLPPPASIPAPVVPSIPPSPSVPTPTPVVSPPKASLPSATTPTPVAITLPIGSTSILGGICLLRNNTVLEPRYFDFDAGVGYAKLTKKGINTLSGLRAVCTSDDYATLLKNYCLSNTAPAEQQVLTFDLSGNWFAVGCGPFGCNYVTCPATSTPSSSSAPSSQVTTGNIDLYPDIPTIAPVVPVSGQLVTFSVNIHNDGSDPAPATRASLRIDQDADGSYETIANPAPVASIPGHGIQSIQWVNVWVASQGVDGAGDRAEVCVDSDQNISELNEINNCKLVNFLVLPPTNALPDYITNFGVNDTAIPATAHAGDGIIFTTQVKNQGQGKGSVATQVRVCVDSQNCANSVTGQIQAYSIGALRYGDVTTPVAARWVATSGTHTITVCADSLQAIDEGDETNNCTSATVVVP